jgi:hypothetical protein
MKVKLFPTFQKPAVPASAVTHAPPPAAAQLRSPSLPRDTFSTGQELALRNRASRFLGAGGLGPSAGPSAGGAGVSANMLQLLGTRGLNVPIATDNELRLMGGLRKERNFDRLPDREITSNPDTPAFQQAMGIEEPEIIDLRHDYEGPVVVIDSNSWDPNLLMEAVGHLWGAGEGVAAMNDSAGHYDLVCSIAHYYLPYALVSGQAFSEPGGANGGPKHDPVDAIQDAVAITGTDNGIIAIPGVFDVSPATMASDVLPLLVNAASQPGGPVVIVASGSLSGKDYFSDTTPYAGQWNAAWGPTPSTNGEAITTLLQQPGIVVIETLGPDNQGGQPMPAGGESTVDVTFNSPNGWGSVGTPTAAASVAALRQARPDLTAAQIDQLIAHIEQSQPGAGLHAPTMIATADTLFPR